MTERYLLSVITRNSPGVLSRIAGLLRRKLFNIDSLTVGRMPERNESCFTIVIEGDKIQAQKAAKLIDRLIEVRRVEVLETEKCLRREIVLAKFELENSDQKKLLEDAEKKVFHHTISENGNTICVELIDTSQHIDDFLTAIQRDGIKVLDWVRSGVIAMKK